MAAPDALCLERRAAHPEQAARCLEAAPNSAFAVPDSAADDPHMLVPRRMTLREETNDFDRAEYPEHCTEPVADPAMLEPSVPVPQ